MKILFYPHNAPMELRKVNTFTEIQALVGGLVEPAGVKNDLTILVNEEGIPKGLPTNPHFLELLGNVVLAPEGWDDLPYE